MTNGRRCPPTRPYDKASPAMMARGGFVYVAATGPYFMFSL